MRTCVWITTFLLLISGCGVSVKSPNDPLELIPDRSDEIRIGQTGRASVRSLFGEPLFHSSYWGFDLFRVGTNHTEVPVAITPVPVPFAVRQDHIYRYTLVTYDAAGLVSDVATGLYREPGAWGVPIEGTYTALHLRASNVMLFSQIVGVKGINILVAPVSQDVFVKDTSLSQSCAMIIGCGNWGTGFASCADQVSVDSSKIFNLPMRKIPAIKLKEDWTRDIEQYSWNGPWTTVLETLAVVNISPGDHQLEFSSKKLGSKYSTKVSCNSGQEIYLAVDATVQDGNLINWKAEQTAKIPSIFERRPLIIISEDMWMVDSEPKK